MKSTGAMASTISGNFDTSKGDLRLAQVYVDKKYFPDSMSFSLDLFISPLRELEGGIT